jgi:GNAT superfamily N-acetyltransferase
MTPDVINWCHDPGMPPTSDLEIVPLTGERFAELAELFATGDPRWCWCMYFRARGRTWSNSSPEANRAELRKLAENGDRKDSIAPGLVAFREGSAVGWVSLAPREDYERLAFSTMLRPIDDRPVWSIVCFVVGRHHRRQGVAAALLEAAIDYARAHGARTLEGYPLHESRGKVASSAAYVGTQAMFERAGFTVAELRSWDSSSPPRPIMRLELG